MLNIGADIKMAGKMYSCLVLNSAAQKVVGVISREYIYW